jgi:SRSO17 transposase
VIVDDTGFPKQGRHPVGVARQSTGTLGQVANCQVAGTPRYATERDVFALEAERSLPLDWGTGRNRLAAAGVPEGLGDRPKWRIALELLGRARVNGVRGVVPADSAPGDATEFRQALDEGHWPYGVGVSSTLKVVAADHDFGPAPPSRGKGRPPSRPARVRAGVESPSVQEWAQARAPDVRRVTRREGSKGKLTSRFAARRVRPAHRLSAGQEPLAACGLLVEWPEGEAEPTEYFFSNLPAGTSRRRLVRTAQGRWWVEHSSKELKDELGWGHFEGRGGRGWQHPGTRVLLADAFLAWRRRQRRKKGAARG